MLDRLDVAGWHLPHWFATFVLFALVSAARHQHEVEALDLLQVRGHAVLAHLPLERLSIRQLVFLLTRSQARTPTPNPDEVFLVDGFADVEHLDHLAPLGLLIHDNAGALLRGHRRSF